MEKTREQLEDEWRQETLNVLKNILGRLDRLEQKAAQTEPSFVICSLPGITETTLQTSYMYLEAGKPVTHGTYLRLLPEGGATEHSIAKAALLGVYGILQTRMLMSSQAKDIYIYSHPELLNKLFGGCTWEKDIQDLLSDIAKLQSEQNLVFKPLRVMPLEFKKFLDGQNKE